MNEFFKEFEFTNQNNLAPVSLNPVPGKEGG